MKKIFETASYSWIVYSKYEFKTLKDGTLYIKPTDDAMPNFTSPFKNAEEMILEAVTIGTSCIYKDPDEKLKGDILGFISKYGLLGFMTSIPTTTSFMDYEAVYFMKNQFIKKETMKTEDYLSMFFPFEKQDVIKNGIESLWNISEDKTMMALAMTMGDKPMAVNMGFQRDYAERYDWLKKQFIDWAFTLSTTIMYYHENIDDDLKEMYKKSITIFDGNSPTYHIAFYDKPTLVWDFHSLLLGIQMILSFMLTDEKTPLKQCKHCCKPFIASRPSAVFCSPKCKNQYNVYKSRAKNKK